MLAHDMVLAGDLHQPLALQHMVNLLLNPVLVRGATWAIG